MENQELQQLSYPIGTYVIPDSITPTHLKAWITVLETLPQRLTTLVTGLDDTQLNTPYRTGGWSVRQVVHHLSDSHHHSYVRFKWALTEDNPIIKPYMEKEWANLFDSQIAPIGPSLNHLSAVHAKLVYLLKGLSTEQWQRTFTHPADQITTTLAENAGRYAWHSDHHFAHINNLILRKGW
ncbi:MAG: YfiT family bacillithiol transferase [Bacteroidota bacterium]